MATRTLKFLSALLFLLIFSIGSQGHSEVLNKIRIESSATWQQMNNQRVPGDSGTRFSLSDYNNGAIPTYRIAASIQVDDHEWHILYAPVEIELNGTPDKSIIFSGETFSANEKTQFYYKFNSYRIGYIYHPQVGKKWSYGFGVTAKVRDAEVRITQGALKAKKANVGFVPLFHLEATRQLTTSLDFFTEFEGLAASQGRAIDLGLFLRQKIGDYNSKLVLGVRTLEGGADNKKVYNFAWFNSVVLGVTGIF